MKYKELEFLSNPSKTEIKSESIVSRTALISGKSSVQNLYKKPILICVSGTVFDNEGKDWCNRMLFYLKDRKSGWLFTPNTEPVKAYLTSFSFKQSSNTNEILYDAEFCEERSGKGFFENIKYTFAKKDENAFDIADRCFISVDCLEELNGYFSPFDIKENDRVIIK